MKRLIYLLVSLFLMTFMACSNDVQEQEQLSCKGGEIKCDKQCVSPSSSKHCGACDNACISKETCQQDGDSWACRCEAGFERCDGACMPLNKPQNCGACGNVCLSEETCTQNGDTWACRCEVGFERCDGKCIPVNTNERCGACTNTCTGNEKCERTGGAYRCLCYDGAVLIDTQKDVKNCGKCGYVCPSWRDGMGGVKEKGEEKCTNAMCICDNKKSSCEDGDGNMQLCTYDLKQGTELKIDNGGYVLTHCGACDHQCERGFTCVDGLCKCGAKDSCAANEQCSDGLCKCGKNAEFICSNASVCEDDFCKCLNNKACKTTETCDLDTGKCMCGALGATCRGDETCEGGLCKCGGTVACSPELLCKAGACVCAANANKACPERTTCTSEGCLCGALKCSEFEFCNEKPNGDKNCQCRGETLPCQSGQTCTALGCRCGESETKCKAGEACDGTICYCEPVGKKTCSKGANCINAQCKCQGGPDCNVGETCLTSGVCECKSASRKPCLKGETCLSNASCQCGTKACSEITADACVGVSCRCGTGPACNANQACRDGKCSCKNRPCKVNELCDAAGDCKCGTQSCEKNETCRQDLLVSDYRCHCDLSSCHQGERCRDKYVSDCTDCGLSNACILSCTPFTSECGCIKDADCRGAETCVNKVCLCGNDRSCRYGTQCIEADKGGRQCIKNGPSDQCYPNESNYTFKVGGVSMTGCVCDSSNASDIRGCKRGKRCEAKTCVDGYDYFIVP